MKKQILHWFLVVLISYLPIIIIHWLIRPLWCTTGIDTRATMLSGLMTALVFPVYLCLVNYFLAKKYNMLTLIFILNVLIILFGIWFSGFLDLVNWSSACTNKIYARWNDTETNGVVYLKILCGFIVAIIAFIPIFYKIGKRRK